MKEVNKKTGSGFWESIEQMVYQKISCWGTTFKTIYRNISDKKFESEVYALNKFISPGSICLDIGAAYGRYAFVMSKLAGNSGCVFSFEPGNYSFKVLSNVVRFHRLKNVTLVKRALADKKGAAELSTPIKRDGKIGPSLAYLTTEKFDNNCAVELVKAITLDDYCSEINIPRVDFIKCDVEGAELLVFKGAKDVIVRYKPTVLCEVDKGHLKRFSLTPEQIYDFFCQRNYKSFILKEKKFEKVNCIKENHNYFFIHSQAKVLKTLGGSDYGE